MKKVLSGFIVGCVVATTVSVFAASISATPNEYKVTVNGKAAALEGYNISGSTYFKLRDVASAIGGFEVGFEDNTITITTTTTSAPAATERKSDSSVSTAEQTDAPSTERGGTPPSVEDLKTKLAQDVADGKMTQEQADEMIANMESGNMQRPSGGGGTPPDGAEKQ